MNENGMNEEVRIPKKEARLLARQERAQESALQDRRSRMKKIVALVGVVVLLGFGIFAIQRSYRPDGSTSGSPDPALGPATAPVVLKEYSDFQCPACQAAAAVVKDLLGEYGDQIRFEYNDFPLQQHVFSKDAAVGAQCANEQGKFFEMHDILFDRQNDWSVADNRPAAQKFFRGIAEDLGLDMAAFDTCTSGESAANLVNEDLAEGRRLGVNATPTFFVNGKRVVGTPLAEQLRKAIDNALAQ